MNLFDNGGRSGEGKTFLSGKLRYIPILLIVFLLALGGGRLKLPGSASVPGSAMEESEEREESSQEETAEEAAELPSAAAEETPATVPVTESTEPESVKAQDVTVYVCGYVRYPGVYQLAADCRVMDAVNAAGGFLDEADTEYWNLAEPLADGEQIRIPSGDESETMETRMTVTSGGTAAAGTAGGSSGGGSGGPAGSGGGGLVNLNTADSAELQTLTGIGASRAAAIIAYREEYGAFRTIEDVMNVSGIKEASFAKIKDHITV